MLLQGYRDQMQGEDTNIGHRRECEREEIEELEVTRLFPLAIPTHDTTQGGWGDAGERNTESAAAADSGIRHVHSS